MVARVRAQEPGSLGTPCSKNGPKESKERSQIRAAISASGEGQRTERTPFDLLVTFNGGFLARTRTAPAPPAPLLFRSVRGKVMLARIPKLFSDS